MSRLTPIQTNGASSELKRSLKNSHLKLDEVPRFLQVMANSPASLRAYIRADAALVRGQLTPRQRQQVALARAPHLPGCRPATKDRKSTRLNSSHGYISYAVFCLKKKK